MYFVVIIDLECKSEWALIITILVLLQPYKFQLNHPIFGSTFPLSSLLFTKPLLSKGFVFRVILQNRTYKVVSSFTCQLVKKNVFLQQILRYENHECRRV